MSEAWGWDQGPCLGSHRQGPAGKTREGAADRPGGGTSPPGPARCPRRERDWPCAKTWASETFQHSASLRLGPDWMLGSCCPGPAELFPGLSQVRLTCASRPTPTFLRAQSWVPKGTFYGKKWKRKEKNWPLAVPLSSCPHPPQRPCEPPPLSPLWWGKKARGA